MKANSSNVIRFCFVLYLSKYEIGKSIENLCSFAFVVITLIITSHVAFQEFLKYLVKTNIIWYKVISVSRKEVRIIP